MLISPQAGGAPYPHRPLCFPLKSYIIVCNFYPPFLNSAVEYSQRKIRRLPGYWYQVLFLQKPAITSQCADISWRMRDYLYLLTKRFTDSLQLHR